MTRAVISAFLISLALTAPAASGQDLHRQAVVTTSEGTFVLSFYPDKAPRHVSCFSSWLRRARTTGPSFTGSSGGGSSRAATR